MNVKEKISYLPSAMAYQELLKRDIKSAAFKITGFILDDMQKWERLIK